MNIQHDGTTDYRAGGTLGTLHWKVAFSPVRVIIQPCRRETLELCKLIAKLSPVPASPEAEIAL